MKKLLFLLFLASPALATDVRVVNSTNNPVNVTGSISVNSSTHTSVDNFPAIQNTATVNTTTVTFNGVGQPVTQSGVWSITANQGTQAYNIVSTNTLPVSGTFFPTNQAVTVTTGGVTATQGTQAYNIVSTNTLTTSISGTPTVTFSATGVGASTASVIPLRPSQGNGRTYKTGLLDNLTGNATAYTVTAGKTLYITSLNISGFNSSTTNAGDVDIQDGATNRIPISIPTAGVGALASQVPVSALPFVFQEPKQFSISVNVRIVTGTVTYSLDFTGYEE